MFSKKLIRPIPGHLIGIEFQLASRNFVKGNRVRVSKSHHLGSLAGQRGTILAANKMTIDKNGFKEVQYEGNDGQWVKNTNPVIWLEPVDREKYGIYINVKLDSHPCSYWCFYKYDDLEVLDYILI